jgi:hypothetical protein
LSPSETYFRAFGRASETEVQDGVPTSDVFRATAQNVDERSL